MRGFKGFNVGHGHQVVRVGSGLGAAIDDAGRRHEVLHGYGVDRVVRQVAARNPVDGGGSIASTPIAKLTRVGLDLSMIGSLGYAPTGMPF